MDKKESWLPEGTIVSMCEFEGYIYAATTEGIYRSRNGGGFHRMKFVEVEKE